LRTPEPVTTRVSICQRFGPGGPEYPPRFRGHEPAHAAEITPTLAAVGRAGKNGATVEGLSAQRKRSCLETVTTGRLREILDALGVAPSSRRQKSDLVAALADGRRVPFGDVLEHLKLAELKGVCKVLELDSTGRVKKKLVDRILANGAERAEPPPRRASSKPPISVRSSGTLKAALRAFVLETAGGYRGRNAAEKFTTKLFQAFGWETGHPPEADVPATLPVVEHGQRTERRVAAMWKQRRVLVEVVKHDVMLDFAWTELLRACLQVDPVPQYVLLTNQRDLHLYDLPRSREEPRLSIPVEDLPKYSEAFPYLSKDWVPGTLPKIINVTKVSREVADLVARLYRSLKAQHPDRETEVIQFTLQCIITMFAEDIGLLPQEHFTSLLYDGARQGDVERRLRDLFHVMSTRDVPGPRAVPYFNGGLFETPVSLPLGAAQLTALTKAAEANWTYVDPHIFGSVFQGIMDDEERHASGAHYTAHDDIMRVVGPTIVEPWRERIQSARSLKDLLEIRTDLLEFRVLDPACGSGNFLYIAFRELYRLDTELLARFREFPSTQGTSKNRVTWSAGIQTSNFYGIDINPFAVELAKVTLNIAKKIAYEERRDTAIELLGQVEMDIDPSLPLDNLDKNIICDDALFIDWPEIDTIVGNPPMLGGTKIREELGVDYVARLRRRFPEVHGKSDYCAFWFRRAHEHLPCDGRAGLVGTQSIRVAKTREASLDYIVAGGGTITSAVSSRPWPGEAMVTVSMVNWVKGEVQGPHRLEVDGELFEQARIASHLQLHADTSEAKTIAANGLHTIQGIQLGTKKFEVRSDRIADIARDPSARPFLRPAASADGLLRGGAETSPTYVIDMTTCASESEARAGGAAFSYISEHVLPFVKKKAEEATTGHYKKWLETWWRPRTPRAEFLAKVEDKRRLIVCSRHASRPIFMFVSHEFVLLDSLQVFAFDDDYSFGIIQSNLHWRWATVKGSKIEERIRYLTPVWKTFPWPQGAGEREVIRVAEAARQLRATRRELMDQNNWSLRSLHQAADVPGTHPLKDAQAALDAAVADAYGRPAGQAAIEFLLELNTCLVEDEADGLKVCGPGIPAGLDPRDAKWTSDDCIKPPDI